ncbi:protein croquemort-like [Aricia agestis]|uniref:protein croquemort-like n=1 Tax=Aricia agestis TaxID=91739 RepID=UPI001C209BF7|nr:protein croquemort-like [Aricia agestis]XP_041984350.1 protein croquemort-like [Aricia agestis]XP_041984358.1 protein croquemort-like [Aricia agestis]
MVASRRSEWLIGFGVAVFSIGVVLASIWPAFFYSKIKDMMILRNGSMSFEIWRDIPIPIYLECFLFNITNMDDILAKKADKLQVEQIGPYVFREIHKKVNISWNNNSTVTYRNQRWWYYQPDMSSGSLADMVTSINPIVATIAYSIRNDNIMVKTLVDMVMRSYSQHMFLTANVSSWLFDGIQLPLLDFAAQIPALPYTIPFQKFGWFYTRNGSTTVDGVFATNTGEADFTRLGLTEMWQNKNRTMFNGKCGEVKGTTGELWALDSNVEEINIFATDLCTYMTLKKTGEIKRNGLSGLEFMADDSLFDNGHKYPDRSCYCDGLYEEDCLVGVLNVSACHFGAPAFVSLPHFYGLDDSPYPGKIEGLRPTEEHNFKMEIEPITGMPLFVRAQLQVNALVRHVPGISLVNQLPDPDTLVPMFWFREEIAVTPEYAEFAQSALDVRFGMVYGFYVLIVTGVALICSGVWFYRLSRFSVTREKESDKMAAQTFLDKNELIRTEKN